MALLAFLASLPPAFVFFSSLLVLLTVVGAFVLRFDWEEEEEVYQEVAPDGTPRIAFQFPPHESRDDRRRRWIRAVRRRFWHGLAKPDSSSAAKTDVDKFLATLVAAAQPSSMLKNGSFSVASTPSWDFIDPEVEFMVYQQPAPPVTLSPEDAEKLRMKLLHVVMNAGPPKSLVPIQEETPRHASCQCADVEACHCSPAPQSLWSWLLSPSKPLQCPSGGSHLDCEAVMTVGDVTASRDTLWAALRKLEAFVC